MTEMPEPQLQAPPALSAVQQTMLIPLVARALGGGLFPGHACGDQQAAELVRRLRLHTAPYLVDRPTVLNILWRTKVIRDAGLAFFARHPQAWGVNLGCGLSHYFQWLDNGQNTWLDADMPQSMELRRRLLAPGGERLRSAIIDLRRRSWWQDLQLPPAALAQPLFMLCEGVLMYLQPQQVRQVLQAFATQAPAGSRLVIDILAGCAVGMAQWHASVGPTNAQFHWGIRSLSELTDCHPRLRLLATHSVASSHGWMGLAAERMWNYWSSTPLYGVVELGVE
ncbi:MAG: class I SAM-dependent methyltransferase [Proteobacteria bacterium]|nr:class I SAM-dependent methyltransferase [Pseudomonadota bacterium]